MLLPLSAIEARFDAVLERWYRLWLVYEPVLDLVLSHSSGQNSVETYFLESVQTAELLHRRHRPDATAEGPNHYAARLDRVLAAASSEDAAWLRGKLQWSNEPTLQQRLNDLVQTSRLALRLSGDQDFARTVAQNTELLDSPIDHDTIGRAGTRAVVAWSPDKSNHQDDSLDRTRLR